MLSGQYPGTPQVLQRYDTARRADISSRTFAIDIANRSLLSDFLPVQLLRATGLPLIDAFGPLRRIAMREGLAPSWRSRRGVSGLSRMPAHASYIFPGYLTTMRPLGGLQPQT